MKNYIYPMHDGTLSQMIQSGPKTRQALANLPTAKLPPRLEEEALNDTYAPVADTLHLRNMTDLASSDRGKSSANSRVAYEDATSFIESWTDLTSWSSSTFAQVSGGRLYSASQAARSGANHSFALRADDTMRAIFNVQTIAYNGTGAVGGGLIVGVSSDSAGGAFTVASATMQGMYFRQTDITTITNGSTGASITGLSGTQDWVVTLTVDLSWITVTAVLATNNGIEYRAKWARNTVNNISVFNSDARNLTGHSIGKVGVRKATVTITPRTGVEGVAVSPNWTTVGSTNMRVALPVNYDSRKPSPVVMLFHGNGSNETHFSDHAAGKAVANAFLAAGYIAVSAANGPNVSTWGAQAGLDAYYSAYKYVRDHYSIGPIVLYGNSMGGLESLLTLAERRIPGIVSWVGTVPICNLRANYIGAMFKDTISTAYGITADGSNYDSETAGHDAVLKDGTAFRGVPMWVLVATDDAVAIPSENFDVLQPIVEPFAAELIRVNVTGGHSTSAIVANATTMVTFANKYVSA